MIETVIAQFGQLISLNKVSFYCPKVYYCIFASNTTDVYSLLFIFVFEVPPFCGKFCCYCWARDELLLSARI